MELPVDWNEQIAFTIVFCLMVAFTLLCVLARLYIRVYLRGDIFCWKSWNWSDILVVIAWLGFLECCIINFVVVVIMKYTPGNTDARHEEPSFKSVRQVNFFFGVSFWFWIFVIKGALCCFFNEIIPKNIFKCWVAIRVVGGLVAVGAVSTLIYGMTWCQPFNRWWKWGDEFCWVEYTARYTQTIYRQMWHVGCDLLILAIPIPLIPQLRNITTKQRIGAAVMLGLGLFCTVSAIIYTLAVLQWDKGALASPSAARYLQYEPIIELAGAIMIQCVPSIRVLLTRLFSKEVTTKGVMTGYGYSTNGSPSRSGSASSQGGKRKDRSFVYEHDVEMSGELKVPETSDRGDSRTELVRPTRF